jgi:HK97 family phage portal protein
MSRALFWQTLVSWEALRGEFFVAPLDEAGQPVAMGRRAAIKQMIPLCPDCFAHVVENSQIAGWRYSCDGGASPVAAQALLPEEVVHWRNFNPYHFWRGLPPLAVAMLPAASDYAAEQFMKGLMSNNGDAGLIVTTEEMLDPTQREQFMAALSDRKRRAGTADRPLFLWGKAKVETPAVSSVDLQFLDNRKLNRQEIGAVFKVPESMMGFAGEKSALSAGSAIEQDRLTFIENTVSALCRRLESAMEPLIKSMDPMLDGWFDLDSLPIMQAARRDRMATAAKAFSMGVPFNELNQVYDLGFESLPWGNRGYIPATLREIGETTFDPGAEAPSAGVDAPAQRLLRLLESPAAGALDPQAAESARRKCGKLSRFFFEQRARALEALEKARSAPDESANVRASDLFDIPAETALLGARLNPLFIEDFKAARESENARFDPEGAGVLLDALEPRLRELNAQTAARLNAALGGAFQGGPGIEPHREAVKRAFAERSETAGRVAMELTLQALAAGREDAEANPSPE